MILMAMSHVTTLTHNGLWIAIKEQFLGHNALDVVACLMRIIIMFPITSVLFENTKWLLELFHRTLESMCPQRHDWMLCQKRIKNYKQIGM